MADLPDDLERLEGIAANLRHRLAGVEARIRRLKDSQPCDCRVNRAMTDTGQPCDCPIATCKMSRGGLRPAGVPTVYAPDKGAAFSAWEKHPLYDKTSHPVSHFDAGWMAAKAAYGVAAVHHQTFQKSPADGTDPR